MSRSSSLLVAVVSILIAFGSACTTTHNIPLDPNLSSLPAVEKQPYTLGVYYSEEFRTYVHQQALGSDWFVVNLGEASTKLFDRLFSSACERVIPVSRFPTGERVAGVAAIIEPRIEAFQIHSWLQTEAKDVSRITFRIIVYTPEGFPALSQVIKGRGKEGTMNSDLEDAGRKFLEGFSAWYESYLRSGAGQEIKVPPFDQRLVSATAEPCTNKVEMKSGTKEASRYPFSESGVIAVRVTMRNDSEREVLTRGSDMHLLLSDGSRIVPACATVVIERLEEARHAADTAVAWLMPFGMPLTMIGQAGSRNASLVDLNEKQLGDKKLAPGETAEGLIYFVPTEGTPAFTNAKLEVWCVSPDTLSSLRLELPLDDLTFTPVKRK